jgi:Domain of unknown function (DUF4105)
MTPSEKQAIYDRLLDNLKEQNRYYKYDFLYDNCSTRIRDDIKYIRGNGWITLPSAGRQQLQTGVRQHLLLQSLDGFWH